MTRATLAFALACALSCGLGASVARADEGDARLRQAEALAKKKERDAAMDVYRAILGEGSDGADVRYNLGTLCLEEGDLGCAVLHLRAAARMDPLDGDVRHNLEVALEARTDRLAGSPIVDPIRSLGARVPSFAARLGLAIPLVVLGLALVLLALLHGRARLRLIARALASISALACVAGGAVYASRLVVERTREAVVVVPETSALKDPDTSGTVAFTAHAGLHGEIVGTEGELVRVRFENGLESWLRTSAVAILEARR